MNATRLKKRLTLAGLILTIGFTKPVLNVNAAMVENYIEDNDELHKYYDKASKEDLLNSLEQNPYLSNNHKEYVKDFIEKIYKKYPDLDYTILNENLKDLQIFERSTDDIVNNSNSGNKDVKGYYLLYENEIYISTDVEYKEYVLFHELWHATSNLYIDDIKTFKSPTYGFSYGEAFDEGITTYLTNSILFDRYLSYEKQVFIVEMLVEKYGEKIIFEYLDKGISQILYILSKDSCYTEANNFVKLMDKDLNELTSDQEKKELHKYLFEINDEIKYIVLSNDDVSQVHLLDKIYVVRVANNKKYFVNTRIIKEYLQTGYIRNIYDEEKTYYYEKPIIYSATTLKEFIEDNLYNFIDVYENKIYINADLLDYKSYDIEESVKVLTK